MVHFYHWVITEIVVPTTSITAASTATAAADAATTTFPGIARDITRHYRLSLSVLLNNITYL